MSGIVSLTMGLFLTWYFYEPVEHFGQGWFGPVMGSGLSVAGVILLLFGVASAIYDRLHKKREPTTIIDPR